MTNNDLVYLVNAGNDEGMASMSNDYSFPALGILALGTWLQKRMPDLDVIARDGAIRTTEQIQEEIARLNPAIMGISTLCTSYQNSLKIAKTAKDSGAKVVLGNDQASQTSRLILEHQPNVDYVIGAEYGELPLEMLVRHIRDRQIPLDKIPSLTFRHDGKVVGFDYERDKCKLSLRNQESGYSGIVLEHGLRSNNRDILDIFPIVNRNLYPEDHWKRYLANYLSKFAELHLSPETLSELKKKYPNWLDEENPDYNRYTQEAISLASKIVTGVTTMNRARGCSRKGSDVCKHCDITGVRIGEISMSSPEIFWEEVRTAHDQVKATSFYEACDSFSSFPELIKRIVKARPSNLKFNPEFYVYAQAIDLAEHPERVDMLKEMGVFRVNMGLESMSDKTLKHMKGERDSVKHNERALQLCKDRNIKVYGSFVLGSEAETPETLRETTERVCDLLNDGYLCDAEAQPVLPLAGNYQGEVLRRHGLIYDNPLHPDHPVNVDDSSKIFINRFSGVRHEECIESTKTIRAKAKKCRKNCGSGVSLEKNYK